MLQRNTLITVNRLVRIELPEHERIMWGRLGEIEAVKGTSPRLIKTVTPDVQKAIQYAKYEINVAEEMDQINFYLRALGSSWHCYGSVTDFRDQITIWFGNWERIS